MKKVLMTGVLSVVLLLTACNPNMEQGFVDEKNAQSTGQQEEVKVASNTNKAVSVSPLDLTQEQKEDYYKQYVVIVEQINSMYSDPKLGLVPFNEFKDEDWLEPNEFKQMAMNRAKEEVNSVTYGGDLVK